MTIIKNCFDSHLHWQGIGSFKSRLDLTKMSSLSELKDLKTEPKNFRGDWLLGHGWSDELILKQKVDCPAQFLDDLYPQTPVYFTSQDIHSVWLNSVAIKKLDLENQVWKTKYRGYFDKTKNKLSGIFYDSAKEFIDKRMPSYTNQQIKEQLLGAQKLIHRAGVTHIRDLTCSEQQFGMACELEQSGELQLVVELFFKLFEFSQLNDLVSKIKNLKEVSSRLLNVKGVKLFVDGALGSEGALLSEPYLSGKKGFCLFSEKEIEQVLYTAFINDLEVAVHTIGDLASHKVCQAALKLKNDKAITGQLHLEHAQILSDETINSLAQLKATCHMQPQHWRSDKAWLSQKIPPPLMKNIFRWADLEQQNVPLYLGSDAPVEEMSVGDILSSLAQSEKEGIPPLKKEIQTYLTYPYNSSVSAETHLDKNNSVEKVIFDNKVVFSQQK